MSEKSSFLTGSAGSKEDLEKMINEYFYSTNFRITDDGKIYNIKNQKFLDGYRVIQKRGRWRFEHI